ncbi:hypothetical protein F383_27454 [Gossypium arboreum]|uniref:Uncharacterized protein n=1 Tax=Gossypium arboreum TaxID=29729 RepID=A0A0B0MRB4_GOSAR|nr:hypothetical protein F383_27454 [Gossypium arboreum]
MDHRLRRRSQSHYHFEALGIVSCFIFIMACIRSFDFVKVSHCFEAKCVGLI